MQTRHSFKWRVFLLFSIFDGQGVSFSNSRNILFYFIHLPSAALTEEVPSQDQE